MDCQCDCAICFKTYATQGLAVSLVTIKRHRAKYGPALCQASNSATQSALELLPKKSEEQSLPDLLEAVISSAHDKIIRTSLQSFGNLENTTAGPSASVGRTDGNWLFLSVALVTYLHVVAGPEPCASQV
ncbi:hypothetical protein DFH28DRAFT_1137903 [Melampsora americana]|nr:hypothetical protein DFH28DRAFT_1137903 [Melampsora americana]